MPSLDSNIVGLMNDTVSWEKANASNLYGDFTYAAAKTLSCFVEEKFGSGGAKGLRHADESVTDAFVELYFDANNADVATFSMNDRFTLIAGQEALRSIVTQPDAINVFTGPQGERWITVVTL
jgi:hypothetical protein